MICVSAAFLGAIAGAGCLPPLDDRPHSNTLTYRSWQPLWLAVGAFAVIIPPACLIMVFWGAWLF